MRANTMFISNTDGCCESKYVPLTDCPPTKQADRVPQVDILVRVHVHGGQTLCQHSSVIKRIEQNLAAALWMPSYATGLCMMMTHNLMGPIWAQILHMDYAAFYAGNTTT